MRPLVKSDRYRILESTPIKPITGTSSDNIIISAEYIGFSVIAYRCTLVSVSAQTGDDDRALHIFTRMVASEAVGSKQI